METEIAILDMDSNCWLVVMSRFEGTYTAFLNTAPFKSLPALIIQIADAQFQSHAVFMRGKLTTRSIPSSQQLRLIWIT
jgi:hypothetical protein